MKLHETPYSNKDLAQFLIAYYYKIKPEEQSALVEGGTYSILECRDCGLYFQREIPDDAASADIYEYWVGQADPLAPYEPPPKPLDYYSYKASEIMQITAYLQKKLGTDRRLTFLDFGIGWGEWSQMARSFGADVYGVELSKQKIEYAKSLGLKLIDIEDLEKYKFDFINTEQVLEHVPEPRSLVDMLKKCLAPEGILKLSVPDGKGISSILRDWCWKNGYERKDIILPVHPLEHINCFTNDSLAHLAELCGLQRIGLPLSTCYAYSTDWSNIKLISKNLLRPIKRYKFFQGAYALFSHRK